MLLRTRREACSFCVRTNSVPPPVAPKCRFSSYGSAARVDCRERSIGETSVPSTPVALFDPVTRERPHLSQRIDDRRASLIGVRPPNPFTQLIELCYSFIFRSLPNSGEQICID